MTRSLEATFDPKANALNFIRLSLAASVIFWHAFPLSGHDIEIAPIRQFMSQAFVDGFFAISGFLIVGAWMRDPSWRRFLAARALRIFPAFWLCLIVTAVVIAPVAASVVNGGMPWQHISSANASYIVSNSTLSILQNDIAGTPNAVPYEGIWNGSLWTLRWEFVCYLAVMLLGVTKLLRVRAVIPTLFALAVIAAIAFRVWGQPFENGNVIARFGMMFFAGALVYQHRARIPASWPTLIGCAVVVAVSMALPDYRVLGALPLAVLLLGVGARFKAPSLRLPNDISYGVYVYAFPVQQLLASAGVYEWGVLPFALVTLACTIPLAAGSWYFIEKPAMRLRPRVKRPQTVQEIAVDGAQTPSAPGLHP